MAVGGRREGADVSAISQEEWVAFLEGARDEYEGVRARYGAAADAMIGAIGAARSSSDPASTVRNMIAAVETIGSVTGPAGEILSDVVAGLMRVADWLVGTWPAVGKRRGLDDLGSAVERGSLRDSVNRRATASGTMT